MAFPDDFTVFEFIDDCPAGRDLEAELDDHEERVSDLEDIVDRSKAQAMVQEDI